MTWKQQMLLLGFIAVPAFTGYPVNRLDVWIVTGVTWGWVGYLLAVHALILVMLGPDHASTVISAASLITLPVVFVGGTISYLIQLAGFGQPGGTAAYSSHYAALCVTMLTVIPLALSMVAVIPFHEIERHLLLNRKGVTKLEKVLLMFLRVFNHIMYSVIPNILEVMREENRLQIGSDTGEPSHGHTREEQGPRTAGPGRLVRAITSMGIEAICAAVQHIPLWAVEISSLPDRKKD